jgi:hypothetical protein
MFQGKFALAAASALIIAGCAAGPWQQPADHPADPGAAIGVSQPVTALERYRSGAAQSTAPPSADADASSGDAGSHHHHGETSQ